MEIRHKSSTEHGMIYMPAVNWALMVAVVVLCVGFKTSTNLSNAYGMAVSLTMLVTSMLAIIHGRNLFKAGRRLLLVPLAIFMLGAAAIDVLLVTSCAVKFVTGAWFPLVVGLILFVLMSTWTKGSALMRAAVRRLEPPLGPFVAWLAEQPIRVTERTAVYAVADADVVPTAMLQNLKFYRVKHETTLILKANVLEQPAVGEAQQVQVEQLAQGVWRVVVNYGYNDRPDIPAVVTRLQAGGLPVNAGLATYILCRYRVTVAKGSTMVPFVGDLGLWRKVIFAVMQRNASGDVDYYSLPVEAIVEHAAQVAI